MMQTQHYYFSEDYLVPVYDAKYDTQWIGTYRGDYDGHSFTMHLLAVRAIPGQERESMKASIENDIVTFSKVLEQNPDNPTVKSNIEYLRKLLSQFGTVYEKDIRYVHTDWQNMHKNAAKSLHLAQLDKHNLNKSVFFTGIVGIKSR